jgi:macrodomain Ter protein organizer (MatP/YcbG family)
MHEQEIITKIKSIDLEQISAFSLKILLSQLKHGIESNRISALECKERLEKYIKEYGHLPRVKRDLQKFLGIAIP